MDDYDGLARLCAATDLAITGGELNNQGLPEFQTMLEKGCFDWYQPDAVFTGGIAETWEIIRRVGTAGAVYSPHTALDAVIGGVNDWLADGVGEGEVSVLHPSPGSDAGQGRLVELKRPVKLNTLSQRLKSYLGLKTVRTASPAEKNVIRTVALCAGAGSSAFEGIVADCYLTGEMSHHTVMAAIANGSHVILCEHTNTERGYLPAFRKILGKALGDGVDIIVSKRDSDPINFN